MSWLRDFWGAEGLDRFLEVRGSRFEVQGGGYDGAEGWWKAISVVPAAPTLRPSAERSGYGPHKRGPYPILDSAGSEVEGRV